LISKNERKPSQGVGFRFCFNGYLSLLRLEIGNA